MGAGKIVLITFLALSLVAGCKKKSASAPATAPVGDDTFPASAPAEPVASEESIAKFVASAKEFLKALNAMSEALKSGVTLDVYHNEVKKLEAALAAVEDPPADSPDCQQIMTYFREAVLNYKKAETHLIAAAPNPALEKTLAGQALADYQRKVKRSADYRDNCYQTAYRHTVNATKRIEELTAK